MADISGNKSQSAASSDVWGAQSPFLQDLYQQAQSQFQNFQPNTELYGQAQQGMGNLMSGQQNPNLASYAQQFQQQLGQLNQGTGGQAGLTGGYGGGRQGVLESQNQQNVGGQMGRFYGDQYQGDQNRMLGAIQSAPGLMSLDPYQQQQGNLNSYAGAIGGPNNLQQSRSSSKGAGAGIG